MNAEQNLQLIRTIEANREFMLAIYRQNPALLATADDRIKALFAPRPAPPDSTTASDRRG